ncbi:MAG: hypothetical protein R2873_27095 [Caldilineaceae bacterium]
MMMAIRPIWSTRTGWRHRLIRPRGPGLFSDAGAVVQTHGAWQQSVGCTDTPAAATAKKGNGSCR